MFQQMKARLIFGGVSLFLLLFSLGKLGNLLHDWILRSPDGAFWVLFFWVLVVFFSITVLLFLAQIPFRFPKNTSDRENTLSSALGSPLVSTLIGKVVLPFSAGFVDGVRDLPWEKRKN